MNAIEHAVALPPDEVVVHRATRRKILRNIAPLTTGAQDVHQAVHHRTHVGAALAAARPRRRNERRNNRPLLVREVAWVPQMITIVSRSVFLRPHRQPPANQTASFQSQMIPVTPEVSRRTLRTQWLNWFAILTGHIQQYLQPRPPVGPCSRFPHVKWYRLRHAPSPALVQVDARTISERRRCEGALGL